MIVPFTIRASGAEGEGFEPSFPEGEATFRVARQPYPATFRNKSNEWTHRGSNPDLRRATAVPSR